MATPGTLPLPRAFSTFEDWGAWARSLLQVEAYVPIPQEATWQQWADAFVFAPPLQLYTLPGAAAFSGWREWAEAVRRVYPGP